MNSEIVTDTPIGDCNIFDRCVSDLESNGGYALLPLWTLADSQQDNSNDAMPSTISRAFSTTISAMDAISASLSDNQDANVPLINSDTDSGSWTGYHHAASKNGRYNEFREGFVFSNGDMFDVTLQDKSDNSSTTFQHEMNGLFNIMHNVIATGVLSAIERRLELPINYFANELGPTSTSSQWHMKRYAVGDGSSTIANEHDKGILLPVHTDPSLISVVIIDRDGVNDFAMGLEVFHPNKASLPYDITPQQQSSGTWEEVSQHGHEIAVIFVGSVLSYLTKSQIFIAAKHRVVEWWSDSTNRESKVRLAATLFVRPHGEALMKPLPSPCLEIMDTAKKPPTFKEWNARVARNYMKRKKHK